MVNIIPTDKKFDAKRFNAFCKKYNFTFPEAYLTYLSENNDSEFDMNVLRDSDEGVYVRYFYGTTGEDYSDIESVYECYADRMPSKCVPIADPDFGNQICVSLDSGNYGSIYFWDHETMDTEDGETCQLSFDDMILLADSFDELLDRIIPCEAEETIEEASPKGGLIGFLSKIFNR